MNCKHEVISLFVVAIQKTIFATREIIFATRKTIPANPATILAKRRLNPLTNKCLGVFDRRVHAIREKKNNGVLNKKSTRNSGSKPFFIQLLKMTCVFESYFFG